MQKIVKRRKKFLTVIPILFLLLSVGMLYIIEPKYKSSISVLIQEEQALNPFIFFERPVDINTTDRVRTFNEIIYSRSTIEKLIDSLGLDNDVQSELEKQELVDKIRENIETQSPTSKSFEITYYDTDPVRARDGVEILSDYFIQTRLKLEKKRNEERVNFFENKVAELEDVVNSKRTSFANLDEQLNEPTVDKEQLQSTLQDIKNQQVKLSWEIIETENRLRIVEDFLNQDTQDFSAKPLYRLQLSDIPLGENLGNLLDKHNGMKQRYTDRYPDLSSLQSQIREVVNRIYPAIESNLSNLESQRQTLAAKRDSVISDLEQSFIAERQRNSEQTDFSAYQDLYDEMKVKLEQAYISREINKKGEEQYMVIDPPYIPQKPASPNHALVVTGGFLLGILFAGVTVAIIEILDTTVRKEEDLKLKKPVIAYLKDGKA